MLHENEISELEQTRVPSFIQIASILNIKCHFQVFEMYVRTLDYAFDNISIISTFYIRSSEVWCGFEKWLEFVKGRYQQTEFLLRTQSINPTTLAINVNLLSCHLIRYFSQKHCAEVLRAPK